jgi:hypothetical protein
MILAGSAASSLGGFVETGVVHELKGSNGATM